MAIFYIILVLAIGILLLPYWLIKARPFPQPSGQWNIGTSDLIWDAPDRSGIIAKIWCPTDDRITKGVNLDGIFIDPANTNYDNNELLLISSNWLKYSPKDKNTRTRIETIVAKDKVQREQLAAKANLHQRSFPSASHFNFMDLPLIIRSSIGKKIGLFGNIDGLEVLSKTSAEMMNLFDI